jgi:hypothetical protein
MNCLECKNLEEAFESRVGQYIAACSTAFYSVSTELAAKKNVDMERARENLENHRFVCVSAAELRPAGARSIGAAYDWST